MRHNILRLSQVMARTGLCKSTIYSLIAAHKFPKSRQLPGIRSVGWLEADVDAWVDAFAEATNPDNKSSQRGGSQDAA